jgi:quinone-modifying oxidoreductase subunit QmoA
MSESNSLPVLVVGAGIAGVSAALESAESGREVLLVEAEPTIGGRVVRSHHYFPKLCPPTCGMEINARRLERNPRVRVLCSTRVTGAERAEGHWKVKLGRAPEYVNDRCTVCGACAEVCPVKIPDPINLEMGEVPAIRLPFPSAWPQRFVIDREACQDGCQACVDACKYDAIDLAASATDEEVEVASVILATGWRPYPLEKLSELGGGRFPDVIANVNMERLASPWGPTGGKILRPSNGEPPQRVAFVQCAGSRDVNHLHYCSAVCCLASLKQALYVREQLPEAEVCIYYIDRRTPGRNEAMLTKVAAEEGVKLVKGKVGKVEAGPDGTLSLKVEDVEAGRLTEASADLVVLATGMVPNLDGGLPWKLDKDEDGFAVDNLPEGILVAGVARRPQDVAASVRDATGAAAKAWMISEGRHHGTAGTGSLHWLWDRRGS